MSGMIRRGVQNALSTLSDLLDDSPVASPRQFRIDERPSERREQSGEQVEQDTPEEGKRRERAIEVEPEPVPRSPAADMLRRQLRDRASLRRAFLLSEILDQPRAFRPHRPEQNSST